MMEYITKHNNTKTLLVQTSNR